MVLGSLHVGQAGGFDTGIDGGCRKRADSTITYNKIGVRAQKNADEVIE